ncbi:MULTISPECIES: hypothetical protein [Clostridium]|uniref:hypothetical protein n=1 Tax=Clostridium TaxID=1485 RepID=UPI0012FDCCC3|nr:MULTISPECIES: hypothetical protein [Clostridium]
MYNKVTKFNGISLKLYNCPCCNYYQIPYVNDEGYYDDYVMAVSHTDKIKEVQTN